jgi:hypothetical protein
MAKKFLREYFIGIFAGNIRSIVATERVDNNNFIDNR